MENVHGLPEKAHRLVYGGLSRVQLSIGHLRLRQLDVASGVVEDGLYDRNIKIVLFGDGIL